MAAMIEASEVTEGDSLPGLDNGYVFEVEENNGYLSYPSMGGYSSAMPSDTVLIGYHDSNGAECYMLLPGDSMVLVESGEPV